MGNLHPTPERVKLNITTLEVARRLQLEIKPVHPNHMGLCPIPSHKDSRPSFFIYTDEVAGTDNGWYCFGCSRGGDAVGLWAAVTGCSRSEAIQALQVDSEAPKSLRARLGVIDTPMPGLSYLQRLYRRCNDNLRALDQAKLTGVDHALWLVWSQKIDAAFQAGDETYLLRVIATWEAVRQ